MFDLMSLLITRNYNSNLTFFLQTLNNSFQFEGIATMPSGFSFLLKRFLYNLSRSFYFRTSRKYIWKQHFVNFYVVCEKVLSRSGRRGSAICMKDPVEFFKYGCFSLVGKTCLPLLHTVQQQIQCTQH